MDALKWILNLLLTADTNVLILRSNQHQVFGLFTGYFILDDGTKVEIKNEIGFAEKVFNKW